ncbi:MAG: hypothetical protein AAF602_07335 [Myxococcota bacterium]
MFLTALISATLAQANDPTNPPPFECDDISILQPSMPWCAVDVPLSACGDAGGGMATDWMILPMPVLAGMEVTGVQYTLLDGPMGGQMCAASLDHFVMVYMQNWVTGATQVIETFMVNAPSAGDQNLFLSTPFTVGLGESVKIAIRSTSAAPGACASGGAVTCVLGCDGFFDFGATGNPHVAPASESAPPFSVVDSLRRPQVGTWAANVCESQDP